MLEDSICLTLIFLSTFMLGVVSSSRKVEQKVEGFQSTNHPSSELSCKYFLLICELSPNSLVRLLQSGSFSF